MAELLTSRGVSALIDSRLLILQTRHCGIRPITREDVPFIYDLRREDRARFMSPIKEGIEHQYEYFDQYQTRFEAGDEIYYVIRDLRRDTDIGVVRLTEIRTPDACNWESLIVRENTSPQIGIDICIFFYAICFDILGKKFCGPWAVRRSFENMIRIHAQMKMAKIVREDEEFYYFRVSEADYRVHSPRLRHLSFGVIRGVHDE